MRRALVLLSLGLALAGCSAPAAHPCKVDAAAVPPKPAWPGPEDWAVFSLPQPGNGWISSVAVRHDGKAGVYGGSIGGSFIPVHDDVTLIRFKVGPDMDKDLAPSVMLIPGVTLRNYAALAWGPQGLAYGTRSALGVADPDSGKIKRLRELPIGDKKDLNSLPMHNSVVWAPGGDCVGTTVPFPDGKAQLLAWNATGAKAAAHTQPIDFFEKAGTWTGDGVLLVWTSGASPARARWMDPASGASKDAPTPPADAQAFSWIGGGWLTIDMLGTVMHRVPGEPATLLTTIEPKLELLPKEKRKWLRVFASDNGQALFVEESVVAPKKDLRHMHVLTRKGP